MKARRVWVIVPAVVLVPALAFFVAGMVLAGSGPDTIAAFLGWALPAARILVDVTLAGTIGSVVLALWALPDGTTAYRRALTLAGVSSFAATVFSALVAVFTFAKVANLPVSLAPEFSEGLGFFLTSIGIGQAWLAVTLISAVGTVLLFLVTNQTALFFVGVLSTSALLPLALQGHAAGAANHGLAVTGLGLHLLWVCIWLGGLAALVVVRPRLEDSQLAQASARYSTLAMIAFVVVALSGVTSGWIRLGTWENLATPYGGLLIAKTAALIALGLLGAWQRGLALRRLSEGATRAFGWLVVVELAVMGAATGLAQALARTAPPVDQGIPTALTPAQILTGEPLPPELTFARYLTEWRIDPLWLLICAFGIYFYLAGVVRLHRRGDRWPWLRSVLWVIGLVALAYITNGGINAYEHVLFSVHMAAHMSLGMMVPIFLVLGAPVTLAMRAIHKRDDGSRGAREWILMGVHSWFGRFVANPIVATVIFVGSLWVFYYTPVFRWAITDHIGHEWMIFHFLLAGYLFVQSLIGIDPGPKRFGYPLRLVQLFVAMTVHAFFGLAIMQGEGLLLADWFGAMGRTWGDTPLADQQAGGAIAWSVGEIPSVVLAVIVAVQWGRDETRVAKRLDRQAVRDDDADLRAYNEMLGGLAEKNPGSGR